MARRAKGLSVLVAGVVVCALAAGASAQETRRVEIGPQYAAAGAKTTWLGEGYRSLWAAEVSVEVLNLQRTGGGLTPVRVVGQAQSLGLAMRGADGKAYTFRSLHKHPERMLPEAWRDAWPAHLAQDLTAGTHPGAALIQARFAKALGMPVTSPKLVVMPDDPALGAFRKQFAGEIGTIDEFPLAGPNGTPGFMGATEILTSPQFWARWLASPDNRVDSRAFLRARVFDLWVDNFDRHAGQWRFMRIPGQPLWQPLPEDPDFVLVRHDGLGPSLTRTRFPDFLSFSEKFSGRLEGALNNCYEVDRWLLTDLDRESWAAVARDVAARLTDDVIEDAMRSVPPEWYAINGRELAAALATRRQRLVDYVLRVYDLEAQNVDIHLSDQADVVTVTRNPGDTLDVTATTPGSSAPYYRRRFVSGETREVRVYLHGGNDQVTRTGPAGGPIGVRIIAGGGRDTVNEATSGGSDVWRDAGEAIVQKGSGTNVRERAWVHPSPDKNTPWLEPRSYGGWVTAAPVVDYGYDTGALLGVRVGRVGWDFRTRRSPSSEQALTASFATSDVSGLAEYTGLFRRPDSVVAFGLHAGVSDIDRMNFFGYGNDTPQETSRSRYRARQKVVTVAPSLRFEVSKAFEAFVTPELRYSRSRAIAGTLLHELSPLGAEEMGQVAVHGGLLFDSRKRATADPSGPAALASAANPAVSGVSLSVSGFLVPKVWDVTSQYGGVDGVVAAYVGNTRTHLAARLGGRALGGDYAWFDAATVGGRNNRGFPSRRFSGDRSVFGTLSLRSWLFDVSLGVPVKLGAIGFVDTGRVWLEGETSTAWHHSVGGGLMMQPVATKVIVYATAGHSKEGTRFAAGLGLPF